MLAPGAKTGVWEPMGDRMNADGGGEGSRSAPTGRAASAETPSQGCVRRRGLPLGYFRPSLREEKRRSGCLGRGLLPTGRPASAWPAARD
jgi:hypothetical protein